MIDLPVHTLITDENRKGCLLLCGINHGYSKEDERRDAEGIILVESQKSFFSDSNVNDYPFRNRIVNWFAMWGYNLARTKESMGRFEKSIVQTNWLQSCSNNIRGMNVYQSCIDDCESFLETCDVLKPAIIFFFGKELISAFNSRDLAGRVESIFGKKTEDLTWSQKNVYSNGRLCRRFRFGFLRHEILSVVSLPHVTGAQGIANDYIGAFKPEISRLIDPWREYLECRYSASRD